jgi:hypothetical protein
MELSSELNGKNKISLKPPLDALVIMWSCENISQGQINKILRKAIEILGSISEVMR